MNITGKITFKSDKEYVGQNQKEKQQISVIEDAQYPNSLTIDFLGDKVTQLAQVSVGDIVSVSINTRTNEYNGKRYNSINGWKVDLVKQAEEEFIESAPF